MTNAIVDKHHSIIEFISEAIVDTLDDLPIEFVSYDKENVTFLVELKESWLQNLSHPKLNRLAVMFLYLSMGNVWDTLKDPFDTLRIQEFVKINQALNLGDKKPAYYPMLGETLQNKIDAKMPSNETMLFYA